MHKIISEDIFVDKSEQTILRQSRVFSEKKKFLLITGIILACFGVLSSIPLVCIHALNMHILFLSLSSVMLVFSIFLIIVLTRVLMTVKGTEAIAQKSLMKIKTTHNTENLLTLLQ